MLARQEARRGSTALPMHSTGIPRCCGSHVPGWGRRERPCWGFPGWRAPAWCRRPAGGESCPQSPAKGGRRIRRWAGRRHGTAVGHTHGASHETPLPSPRAPHHPSARLIDQQHRNVFPRGEVFKGLLNLLLRRLCRAKGCGRRHARCVDGGSNGAPPAALCPSAKKYYYETTHCRRRSESLRACGCPPGQRQSAAAPSPCPGQLSAQTAPHRHSWLLLLPRGGRGDATRRAATEERAVRRRAAAAAASGGGGGGAGEQTRAAAAFSRAHINWRDVWLLRWRPPRPPPDRGSRRRAPYLVQRRSEGGDAVTYDRQTGKGGQKQAGRSLRSGQPGRALGHLSRSMPPRSHLITFSLLLHL